MLNLALTANVLEAESVSMAGALHPVLIVIVQAERFAKMGPVSTPVSVLSVAQVPTAHWGVASPIAVMVADAQRGRSAPERSVNLIRAQPLGVALSRDV